MGSGGGSDRADWSGCFRDRAGDQTEYLHHQTDGNADRGRETVERSRGAQPGIP